MTPSDREFASTARVLRSPALTLKGCEDLIDVQRQSIDVEPLLETGGWSHGEKLLARVALDMWNGSGHTPLGELMYTLDDGNLRAVLEAVALRRGLDGPL